MYIYMYTYACIYNVYIYTYVHIFIIIYMYVHTCIYAYTYIHLHICIYTCTTQIKISSAKSTTKVRDSMDTPRNDKSDSLVRKANLAQVYIHEPWFIHKCAVTHFAFDVPRKKRSDPLARTTNLAPVLCIRMTHVSWRIELTHITHMN